jgi:hypothetical protein
MSAESRFLFVVYVEQVTDTVNWKNQRGMVGAVYESRAEADKMAKDMERVLKNEIGGDFDVWVGRIHRRAQ